MKRFTILLFAAIMLPALVVAQTRYEDEVFTDVTITKDVVYGENYTGITGTVELADLKLDVYEPVADTANGPFYDSLRPVIILLHAGSFLPKGPFLPFGDKSDSVMIEMCTQFAKRGFVAISADYRIGWNPLAATEALRAESIINAVYVAVQDARTCVRYVRSEVDNGNPLRIDPYQVVIGGTNSGAYVALGVSSFNKQAELNLLKFLDPVTGESFIDQVESGGFYGEGGYTGTNVVNHPGYSSAVQCVLNMGGAAGDSTWIEAGEAPIVSFHGAGDVLTPFGTGVVIVSATGNEVVEVSGSKAIAQAQAIVGNNADWVSAGFTDSYTTIANSKPIAVEGLFYFAEGYGQDAVANGFEPWAWYDASEGQIASTTNPPNATLFPPPFTGFGSKANPYASRAKAETYIDSIMGYFIPRLMVSLGSVDSAAVETADPSDSTTTRPVGIKDALLPSSTVKIYPNPATSTLVFGLRDANLAMDKIEIFDIAGRRVMNISPTAANVHKADITILNSGMYVVVVTTESGGKIQKKVIIE